MTTVGSTANSDADEFGAPIFDDVDEFISAFDALAVEDRHVIADPKATTISLDSMEVERVKLLWLHGDTPIDPPAFQLSWSDAGRYFTRPTFFSDDRSAIWWRRAIDYDPLTIHMKRAHPTQFQAARVPALRAALASVGGEFSFHRNGTITAFYLHDGYTKLYDIGKRYSNWIGIMVVCSPRKVAFGTHSTTLTPGDLHIFYGDRLSVSMCADTKISRQPAFLLVFPFQLRKCQR